MGLRENNHSPTSLCRLPMLLTNGALFQARYVWAKPPSWDKLLQRQHHLEKKKKLLLQPLHAFERHMSCPR